jgi:hypothetical protein
MKLTDKEIRYGVKIITCELGNPHKIQGMGEIILPYNCGKTCLKEDYLTLLQEEMI